ncbi:MAG: PD-(D/E)XK nuclease family protein [Acidobacteriota bacterium]
MRVVFDADFDKGCWPGPLRGGPAAAGEDWVGPSQLVQLLETALGLGGPEHTSRERAAMLVPSIRSTHGFWSTSAEVDPFATARRLLTWRDTFAMAGWHGEGAQPRLAALAALTAAAAPGVPDRLRAIHNAMACRSADIDSVELYAPREELEPLWRRTFDVLERRGTRVIETALPSVQSANATDLSGAREKRFVPNGDGTLRLLRASGPLAAAEDVAAWLASLGRLSDVLIVSGDPALDAALHRHGLPTMGASHERRDGAPLQILPLVLDLGWTPQDPQRAYELLSLTSSPVPSELRWRLKGALAKWPAVDSDQWREAMAAGLAAIEDPVRRDRVKQRMAVLWDARVSRSGQYPMPELVRRVAMLRTWLGGRMAVAGQDRDKWGAAAAQCGSLIDLVQHAGLQELSAAQVRHLVIEATEGAGAESPFPPQAGIAHVGSPGGVAGPAPVIVWWDFNASTAQSIGRLPLTRAEHTELRSLGVMLPDPGQLAAAQARRWLRPLAQASERLLLVCPEKDVEGEALHPHPLWDELVSRVRATNTRRIAEAALLRTSLDQDVPRRRRPRLRLPAPRRDWDVAGVPITRRDKESPSSIETLFGCPFQWVLRYVGKIAGPESSQVEEGTSPRVLGELLHRIMNRLFDGPARQPDDAAREAGEVFDREGPRLVAALFLPGRDAQRVHVRRVATTTARSLYALMAAGRLHVISTEQERTGAALGTTFAGRVDLVMGDPPRILDLKWAGAARKRRLLEVGAAIQLAAYSLLERQGHGAFPPVGYFVMDGQRLMTTDSTAFANAEVVKGPAPEETWRLVEATHGLEWKAVAAGRIGARGVTGDSNDQMLKEACVEDGRLRVPPGCQYCDYDALCGRAFEEAI